VSAAASPPHDAGAHAPASTPPGEPCPVCGAPLHPEQSWCLHCGSAARTRLAPAPNWKPPLAVLAVVLALALGSIAAALVDLAGGSGSAPATTTTVTTAAATPATPPASTTAAGARTTATSATGGAPGAGTATKTATSTSTAGAATGTTKTKGTGAATTPGAAGTSGAATRTSTGSAKLSPTVKSEISKGAKERLEQLDSKKALPGASEK
jgi:hypothetical protein